MVEYKIYFTKKAEKDKKLLKQSGLEQKTRELLKTIAIHPYDVSSSCEKLKGNLSGCCSRRINLQHRLVYEVNEINKTIKILSMWSHYENL